MCSYSTLPVYFFVFMGLLLGLLLSALSFVAWGTRWDRTIKRGLRVAAAAAALPLLGMAVWIAMQPPPC